MSRSPVSNVGALLVLAIGLLAGVPGRARAQQLTDQELQQRIDALRPQVERAQVATLEESRRNAEAQRARLAEVADTIMVGPLKVITTPDQVGEARRLFTRAWKDYQPWVQDSPALHDHVFTFSHSLRLVHFFMEGQGQRIEERAWRSDDYVVGRIRTAIGSVLFQDLIGGANNINATNQRLFPWARNVVIPPDRAAHETLYRDLVTAPSKMTQACVAGDPSGCWAALGLGVGPDPWKDWYTPEERRALVVRAVGRYGRRFWPQQYGECYDQRVYTSCDWILAKGIESTVSMPLGWTERSSLVWTAVRLGGANSWSRLVALRDQPPAESLVAVSGVSADELALAWRKETLANPPIVYAGGPWTHLIPLLAILVFAGLAMRSTRWRLG